jgi:hypothetical protein
MQLDNNPGLETYRRMLLEKDYLRTIMVDKNGHVVPARINTETGEIKPYSYKKRPKVPFIKATPKPDRNSPDTPVFWELPLQSLSSAEEVTPTTKAETAPLAKTKRTRNRPGKTTTNPYCGFTDYDSFEACIRREHPEHAEAIENAFVGAAYLDDGGKRHGHSTELLFKLLRDVPQLSTKAVENYTGYSENHCRKLYALMRVIINGIDSGGYLHGKAIVDTVSFTERAKEFAHTPLLWQLDRSLYEEFFATRKAAAAIEVAKTNSKSSASYLNPEEFA